MLKEIAEAIEEDFKNNSKKEYHSGAHITNSGFSNEPNNKGEYDYEFTKYEFEDADEYEKAANEFALTPISDDVEEFEGKDGRLHKFKHSTGDFVLYENNKEDPSNPIIYSYYLMNEGRWERDNKENNPDYVTWRLMNKKYNPYHNRG